MRNLRFLTTLVPRRHVTATCLNLPQIMATCKALPRCTVGSRQAEHESQGESMEEDDMVKSRVGNTLVQETNR